MTPYAMHVDVFGDGRVHPYYGGGPYRADIVRDASNVADIFPTDTFPLITSTTRWSTCMSTATPASGVCWTAGRDFSGQAACLR